MPNLIAERTRMWSLMATPVYANHYRQYDQAPAPISHPKQLYLQSARLARGQRKRRKRWRLLSSPPCARGPSDVRPAASPMFAGEFLFDDADRNTMMRVLGKAGWVAFCEKRSADTDSVVDDDKPETRGRQKHAFRARTGVVKHESFVARARRLDERQRTEAALDLIYDAVDQLMRDNEFEHLDSILAQSPVDRLSVDILLGLLTATLPARSRLPSRGAFFNAAEHSLKRRGVYEQGLLTGLEG